MIQAVPWESTTRGRSTQQYGGVIPSSTLSSAPAVYLRLPSSSFLRDMWRPRLDDQIGLRVIDQLGAEGDFTTPHEHAHQLRALSACATVCKAWLERSRVHLYRTIHVRDLDDLDVLSHAFGQTPSLLSLVEAVHVRAEELSADEWPALDLATNMITQLPNLRAWHYQGFSGASSLTISDDILERFRTAPSLQALSLHDVKFNDPIDAVRLLSAFPSLTEFRCTGDVELGYQSFDGLVDIVGGERWLVSLRHLEDNLKLTTLDVSC